MSESFKNAVAQVKLAYSIVDYIQQSGVSLKSAGVEKWKGLCIFHKESTASFTVNENFQNYRCFGCSASGDIFSFVMHQENLTFSEAVRKLAEDKGIQIDFKNEENSIDYKSLRACIKDATMFFVKEFRNLDEDHAAKREVTETRGLRLDGMTYGYAPDGRRKLYEYLSAKGYTDETILQTGVCVKFENNPKLSDFWHGRLMFIITDITGKPIGFSGRKLFDTDKRGKYVNSMEGPLFDKGASLFNVSKAKKQAADEKKVIVVEGQFDVAAYVEAGALNAVASSGTAFGNKQAMICRRLVTEDGKIIFSFDGDAAGLKAAFSVFKEAPEIHSQAYVVNFPKNQDPCDYRKINGSEALIDFTEKEAKPLIEFVLEVSKEGFDLDSAIDTSKYLKKAATILKTVSSISLRDIYIKKVALDTFTNVETIIKLVKEAEPFAKASQKAGDGEFVKEERNIDEVKASDDTSEESNSDNIPEEFLEEVFDTEAVVEKIKNDEVYNISARLISIALEDYRFRKSLLQVAKLIPKDLRSILVDLSKLDPKSKIIPEIFTHEDLVSFIIDEDFTSNILEPSTEERKDLFVYLCRRLKSAIIERGENAIRSKISKIIQQSKNTDADFLMKALEREDLEIKKLHDRFS